MKRRTPARRGDAVETLAGPWDLSGATHSDLGGWDLRVAGAIPGERIRARIDAVSQGAPVLFGHRLETLAHGPVTRRRSPCPVHVRCGGCPVIVAGEGQLEARVRSGVEGLPAPIRAALVEPGAWIRTSRPLGYRQKAVLLPSWGRGLKLGGFARGTHEVVDQGRCSVLAPALLRAGGAIHRRLEAALSSGRGAVQAPGEAGPPNALRSVILRGNRLGQVLATVVAWGEEARPWLSAALEDALGDGIDGLHFQVCSQPGDRVQGESTTERLAGAGTLREEILGVELTLRPLAFFQVHPEILEGIVHELRAQAPDARRIVDLFCGGGALSLALASGRTGAEVVGVERDPRALASAGKDSRRLGLSARWLEGTPQSCAAELPTSPDLVLLDPPRAGVGRAAMEVVVGLEPRRIAYVSCHAPSLARDAEVLIEAGYRLSRLVPADMLPQTPHVEWVLWFERG